MTQPIRVLRSELTGKIYAVTRYTEHEGGQIVSDEKQDVTADVSGILAMMVDEQTKSLRLLEKLLEAIMPQDRTIPPEALEGSTIEAFSAGRNWMIDLLREIVKDNQKEIT